MDRRKEVVARGYDRLAERYMQWSGRIEDDPRNRMIATFVDRLSDGARVLELGCGAGLPSTKELAQSFDVTGVDISHAQIAMARRNVPGVRFIQADISTLQMPIESFDGVAALYSITHVPRDEHPQLFSSINEWLVPGGLFLASLGAIDSPDWTGEWLGEQMFFSSYDAEGNRALLRGAGFNLLIDETLVTREPDGDETFLWVLAQKPHKPHPFA